MLQFKIQIHDIKKPPVWRRINETCSKKLGTINIIR